MKTVILCGGMGTRLREETEVRSKSMVVNIRQEICKIIDICEEPRWQSN